MTENDFPEKLLYYSNIDKYCVDVILKNTFTITDPIRGFNDPFDCFLEFDFAEWQKEDIINSLRGSFIVENYIEKGKEVADLSEGDKNIIDNYRHELTRGTDETLNKKFSEYATKEFRTFWSKRLRIRSFSAQTEDKTLNNIMFSHYGDSHRGLCYIFDSKKLIQNKPRTSLIKVDYLPKPATVKYKSRDKYSDEEWDEIIRNMVKIKSKGWDYENEWRLRINLATPSENINDTWEFAPDALEGIVLGLKTTTEDKGRINKLAEKRPANVNIYKAERRYGSFCLDYENNKIN
jgi:hypothetical protein